MSLRPSILNKRLLNGCAGGFLGSSHGIPRLPLKSLSLLNRIKLTYPIRQIQTSKKMSSNQFSNTSVPGDKPADPYTAKNKDDEQSLSEKIEALSNFVSANKFGMMTTRASDGLLVSRCMALAAKVLISLDLCWDLSDSCTSIGSRWY